MPAANFVSKVVNLSPVALPLELFPRIALPPGIATVFEPEIIPHADLQKRAGYTLGPGGIGWVNGLTEAGFYIAFPSPWTQWKQDAASSLWQFQGGNVNLVVEIKIFITDRIEGSPYRDEMLQLIMCHELKHWADAVDIVTNWLPGTLKANGDIKRLLFDGGTGQPARLSQKEYDEWITIVNPVTNGYKYEDLADDIYLREHDRRELIRDSSAEYSAYASNMAHLREKHPELVVWPK